MGNDAVEKQQGHRRKKRVSHTAPTGQRIGKLALGTHYSLIIDEMGSDYVVTHFEYSGTADTFVESTIYRDRYDRQFFVRGCSRYYLASFLYF